MCVKIYRRIVAKRIICRVLSSIISITSIRNGTILTQITYRDSKIYVIIVPLVIKPTSRSFYYKWFTNNAYWIICRRLITGVNKISMSSPFLIKPRISSISIIRMQVYDSRNRPRYESSLLNACSVILKCKRRVVFKTVISGNIYTFDILNINCVFARWQTCRRI
jgi:hypothetical protein